VITRGIARHPARGLAADPAGLLEVAATAHPPPERIHVDDHGHVWALAPDRRRVHAIEPSTADLGERVGATLGRRALVVSAADVGVLYRTQRGDDRLARLGIKIAVDPHHPVQ
jgi:hypothetical protein